MDAQNEVVKFKLEEEKEEVNGGKEKFLEKKGSSFKKSGFFELALTSFKEDSYFISDLRESEKKTLHEFKEKIENAIKANQFLVDTAEEGNAKEDHNAATSKEVKAEKSTNQDTNNPDQNGGGTENKSENGKNGAEVVQSHGNDDISIWGIPLLHTKGDERTDVILLKFLRARDFRINDTFVMLQNCIAWRKKFGADNILEEDLAFDENLDSVAFMHCSDKDGHPVCYNAYGVFRDKDIYQKIFGDDEKLKKFLRWRVQILEKGIKLLNFKPGGVNAMIQITDLKNMPKRELRAASNQILALFQDNYPEMVAKKVCN